MDKQKNELIITGVGVAVLLFVLAGNFMKKPAKKPVVIMPPAGSSAGAPLKLPAPLAGEVKQYADDKKIGSQKKRAELPWGRDPFLASIEKEYQISDLSLKGISFGKDKRGFAFINNEIVTKGDKIEDYEVVEVEKDRILLKKGSQNFYLPFPGIAE